MTNLLLLLKKKTKAAPKAVTPQVKRVAYKAANMGLMLLKYSIIEETIFSFEFWIVSFELFRIKDF